MCSFVPLHFYRPRFLSVTVNRHLLSTPQSYFSSEHNCLVDFEIECLAYTSFVLASNLPSWWNKLDQSTRAFHTVLVLIGDGYLRHQGSPVWPLMKRSVYRYAAFIDDGHIKVLNVEEVPSDFKVSDAETLLKGI